MRRTLKLKVPSSDSMDGKKLEYKGEEALKEIERLTEKADEVQKSILTEVLTRNCETEYLFKYMEGSKNILEFKRNVPVITYKGIRPYIQRIVNGEDSSLITGHPITEMLSRSLSLFDSIFLFFFFCGLSSYSKFFCEEINNWCHGTCSSGTSAGEPKLMPSIAEDLDRRTFLYNLIMPIMNRLDNSIFIPIYVMT